MTNFQSITGINTFCGPGVLSALTGKTTDECAAVVSGITGRGRITSMRWEEMLKALNLLGFDHTPTGEVKGVSLFYWISTIRDKPGFYVVGLPKHFVAVEITEDKTVYFIDNHVKQAISATQSARLSQKVDSAYQVVKRREPVLVSSEIQVLKLGNRININKVYTFDIGEAKKVLIGGINLQKEEDLNEIINQMHELNGHTLIRCP